MSSLAKIRFSLASALHLASQVGDRFICAYDKFFSLEDEEAAKVYMGMGEDYAHDGKSEDALAAMRKTLEIQPDNRHAWFQIGMIHLKRQEPGAAIEAFEEAKIRGGGNFEIHSYMAEAFTEHGDHEAALNELKSALKLHPDSAELYFRLGVSLDNQKEYEEAAEAFRKAINFAPRESTYYQSLGFTMESLKQHEEAIECFKRAVELERRRSH